MIPLNDKLAFILKGTKEIKDPRVLPHTMQDCSTFNFHRLQELSWAYQEYLTKLGQVGRFHDLRYAFGTLAVASGVPIRDVPGQMRQSEIQSP